MHFNLQARLLFQLSKNREEMLGMVFIDNILGKKIPASTTT